jgi:hypothetical protein
MFQARDARPKAVVLAAYEAAKRGRYSEASAFPTPEVPKELSKSHAITVAAGVRLRRRLVQLKGRRDLAAARARKTLLALVKSNRLLLSMRMGSRPFLRDLWNGATRGRSLAKIEATRQIIRGPRARVYLRLTLRDGTVVSDSEPLVLRRGEWRLG